MNVREAASRGAREALVEAARDLRQRQTPSEELLWEALRNRKQLGRKFKRQARIRHVVVDFYCSAERLVVEIDGGIHRQQVTADRQRQEELESMGLRVLRVRAEACEDNLDDVLRIVRGAFRPDTELPSPSTRERGRG